MKRMIYFLVLTLSLSKLSAESFLDHLVFGAKEQHLRSSLNSTVQPNFKLKLSDEIPSTSLGFGAFSIQLPSISNSLTPSFKNTWYINLFYTDMDFAKKFHLKEDIHVRSHEGMKTYWARAFEGLTLGIGINF